MRKATAGGEVTVFVYDAAGRVVVEYSNLVQPGGTQYLTQDSLGSTRVVTDKDGAVRSRHDYLPFGEEVGAGIGGRMMQQGYVADNVRQKFTGGERDGETGLDYMQARYYGSTMGRFTSPDPILVTPDRQMFPQLLNLYSYVGNNPLAYVDPTGMERIRLGRSDQAIQSDIAGIDKQLGQEGLTDAQRAQLQQQRQNLASEQEANRIVRAMLDKLDEIGARNGLQVSDFTLSTTPATDFQALYTSKNKLSTKEEKALVAGATDPSTFAMVLRKGDGTLISKEIFILQTSNNYQAIQRGGGSYPAPVGKVTAADFLTSGASNARHEQYHRDTGPSENAAYQLQLRVLNQFGPGAFANKDYYNLVKSYVAAKARKAK